MAGDTQKEISRKLDAKVKNLEISETLGEMARKIKNLVIKFKKKIL